MHVRDIMAQPVFTVRDDATLEDVARLLINRGIGGVPVVDDSGRLVGLVTESDFSAKQRGVPFSTFRYPQVFGQWVPLAGIEQIYQAARTTPVREIMSEEVATATEDEPIEEILRRMVRNDRRRFVVVRDGRPVGMLTRHDLLRMMVGETAAP